MERKRDEVLEVIRRKEKPPFRFSAQTRVTALPVCFPLSPPLFLPCSLLSFPDRTAG